MLKFVAAIDMNIIYLNTGTLLNISKHRFEQSDGLQPTAALPSMLKLIITEYSKRIVQE